MFEWLAIFGQNMEMHVQSIKATEAVLVVPWLQSVDDHKLTNSWWLTKSMAHEKPRGKKGNINTSHLHNTFYISSHQIRTKGS